MSTDENTEGHKHYKDPPRRPQRQQRRVLDYTRPPINVRIEHQAGPVRQSYQAVLRWPMAQDEAAHTAPGL